MMFLFPTTVFLSSFLLFWLELFFSKSLLPQFGGGAPIWTTCLAAFQLLLLLGYGYAWVVAELRPLIQVVIHMILLIAAITSLPLSLHSWEISTIPSFQIFGVVMASIGVPMVTLSTTSSTLQSWYARAFGSNPYWLYALSNVGSLAALIVYPTLLEPNIPTTTQAIVWSVLFACTAFLTAGAIFCAYPHAKQGNQTATPEADPAIQVTRFTICRWFLFAFIPSSLLSGITAYITAEIAPSPVVWSVFLGIYLVTLILAFLPEPITPPRAIGNTIIIFIACFLVLELNSRSYFDRDTLVANIAFFAILCWFYHGWLARLKPLPDRLGQFYFIVALGGASGAIFNALIAPLIFSRLAEYQVVLALSSPLMLSGIDLKQSLRGLRRWVPQNYLTQAYRALFPITAIGFTVIAVLYAHPAFSTPTDFTVERISRSFYSSYLVARNDNIRMLIHGRTLHGRESLDTNDRTPGSYYAPGGPISDIFARLPQNATVAAVGLGTGEISGYARPDQRWTFYEIDPLIVDIAQHDFHHLSKIPAKFNIVIGDGRLQMASVPDRYDLIVMDAFNSDAIPVHLMTVESLQQVFLPHLKDSGAIAYHITNTFLDLEPILEKLAQATGMTALTRSVPSIPDQQHAQSANQWVIFTRNSQLLGQLSSDWKPLKPGKVLWRDDFSSVRAAMRHRQ
jgi:hypothetical protein